MLRGQVRHEFGVSFSGQRIWEIDPDDYINQDHDFGISPSFVYQLNLNDRRLLLRTELSWTKRFSDSESLVEESGFIEYRNDINHLAALSLNRFIIQASSYMFLPYSNIYARIN
jgi:hypothetical protein